MKIKTELTYFTEEFGLDFHSVINSCGFTFIYFFSGDLIQAVEVLPTNESIIKWPHLLFRDSLGGSTTQWLWF